jgi:2,4-dienoyl-CoA reductase-like NADH-dependent reductase (Old Yellow Enzyme family)
MSEPDIEEVIRAFAHTAYLAEKAGFTGVQIHAAHGYLLSQFLSPLTNQRTDQWGGSLENRSRLLLEVVKVVRAQVSAQFCVAVKLNSADFQRGGFDADDALKVVQMLNQLPVDLVELSGGSYEAPAMQGEARDGRTLAREAYFLEIAQEIAKVARMPIMVTGGIRQLPVVEQVLDSGVAMVGIGTRAAPPLARRTTQPPATDADPVEKQALGRPGEHGRGQVPATPSEPWASAQAQGLADLGIGAGPVVHWPPHSAIPQRDEPGRALI